MTKIVHQSFIQRYIKINKEKSGVFCPTYKNTK